MCCVQELCFKYKDIGWKYIDKKWYALQTVCLKGGVAMLSDKADFETKFITRGKENHKCMCI